MARGARAGTGNVYPSSSFINSARRRSRATRRVFTFRVAKGGSLLRPDGMVFVHDSSILSLVFPSSHFSNGVNRGGNDVAYLLVFALSAGRQPSKRISCSQLSPKSYSYMNRKRLVPSGTMSPSFVAVESSISSKSSSINVGSP